MIANPFNHGVCTAVANAKPLGGYAPKVGLSRGRAIQGDVAEDYIIFCGKATLFGWINDYFPAG